MNRINFLPPWVETNLQPAFYDTESGTVLQQTARMYAKVNQLIRNVNDQNETIDLYIAKFIELHDYVHDYFDNLDVQEEINNKLDQMAEDGTLQEIITQYIQANVAWTFDTVADMKSATNLIAGSYARTLGFHSLNDGGGAIYKISDSGTVNEMDVIAVGALYANLIRPEVANPVMLGAYCDGTHDDTDSIQRAVDLYKEVDLIGKSYLTTEAVLITASNLHIYNGTIHTTTEDKVFEFQGSVDRVKINHITCTGEPTVDTVQYFIGWHNDASNNITNCEFSYNDISDMNAGISLNADFEGTFKNILISYNKIHHMVGGTPGHGYGIHCAEGHNNPLNVQVIGNEIYDCGRHCLYFGRGNGYYASNNYIHDNVDFVEPSGYRAAVNFSRSKNITFENNRIADCLNGYIFFSSELQPTSDYPLESYPCENINIVNNIFEGNTNMSTICCGYADADKAHAKNINILNNKFIDTGYIGIYACENVKIDRNCFDPAQDYCIILYGGNYQTESVYTHNIYITNNILNKNGLHRPIRLQTLVTDNDAYILFENNITNFEKFIITQSNVKNNKIQIVNQAWANDFTFTAPATFMPYTVNGVDVTA